MIERRLLPILLSTVSAFAQPANSNRAPSASEQTAAISAIRDYALHYAERLPDYLCTLETQWRVNTYSIGGDQKSTDLIVSQVGLQNHKETEQMTALNGGPVGAADPDQIQSLMRRRNMPRTFSREEFTTLLERIFDPQTATEFHWERWATRDGRRMYEFSYRVPKAKGYAVEEEKRQTVVAFKGAVFADAETNAVTRIEMQATGIPGDSTYQAMSLDLDYKPVFVAEHEFVLPAGYEMNLKYATGATKVVAEYKDYRRFSAQ
jgi:hypothetical protein